ncbi:MAG: sigma-70 family RNA polymerase sigma factor [Acidimicrobiales bacterium]
MGDADLCAHRASRAARLAHRSGRRLLRPMARPRAVGLPPHGRPIGRGGVGPGRVPGRPIALVPGRAPRTYLRTAVVNATRDWGRHQQIVRKHRRSVEQALRPAVGTHEPDELWDALARLDDRRRRAVVLRFYLDLPDPEIAELLGCRPGTVRTLIHRALRDLRREVTP